MTTLIRTTYHGNEATKIILVHNPESGKCATFEMEMIESSNPKVTLQRAELQAMHDTIATILGILEDEQAST